MMYSLPAVSCPEEGLHSLQTNLLGVLTLQKLGASSKTPIKKRHGPYELGGLNIMDLRKETGKTRIKLLRDAVYSSDSEAGRVIQLSIKVTQLGEAGIEEPILEAPHLLLPYITSTWITSIPTFIDLHNI